MNSVAIKLKQYADAYFLQKELDSKLGKLSEGINVSFYSFGQNYSASVNGFSADVRVQIGCIAKSITATMIAIAQMEGKLQLEHCIADYFIDYSTDHAVVMHLQKTKIYHLLNHSNGFDHALIDEAPLTDEGFIDSEEMINRLNGQSIISSAGELFSYASVGCWLVGAILENIYKQPYSEILEHKLLSPLGIKVDHQYCSTRICPSTGKDLQLSAQDLMKIARLHLSGDPNRPELLGYLLNLRSKFSVSSPSWLPAGERSFPGWLDFGNSFGQVGIGANGASVIRLLPEYDSAIVVTSSHQKLASATLAILFGDVLKGLRQIQSPIILNKAQWANIDTVVYQGTFENSKYRLLINIAGNGSLRVRVLRKNNEQGVEDNEPYIKRYYHAGINHYFLASQPELLVCPMLAFSHPRENGLFQYIRTSKYVFRRIAATTE